jgi:hypothetical protein
MNQWIAFGIAWVVVSIAFVLGWVIGHDKGYAKARRTKFKPYNGWENDVIKELKK